MIKDFILKLLFIPLIGLFIPLLTGLINYSSVTTAHLILSNLFFIISWYVTWQGTIYMIAHLRNKKYLESVFVKLTFLCGSAALLTGFIAFLSAILWQQTHPASLPLEPVIKYTLVSAALAIFITLIYEVLFMKKEAELDTKIVDQLDQERLHAEMNALKNELDPHFIFNSLTALTHLINNNTEKAKLFTQKLAQAYKYLLINKDRELISLEEELRFLDNYFFLLQIRHDHKLKLNIEIDESRNNRVMILPCALQILIENAIKHNQFTEADPLMINISLNGVFLNVSNNIRSKPYMVESTNIGLKNLSTRYKLTCNKDIVINRAKEKFIVKLPIIQ